MVRKWSEVESDPRFQGLPGAQQQQVRQKWLDTVLSDPNFAATPKEKVDEARRRIGLVQEPPPPQSPLISLAGRLSEAITRYSEGVTSYANGDNVDPEREAGRRASELAKLNKHAQEVGAAIDQSLPEYQRVQQWNEAKKLNPESMLDHVKTSGLVPALAKIGVRNVLGEADLIRKAASLPRQYVSDPSLTLLQQLGYKIGSIGKAPGAPTYYDKAKVEDALGKLSDAANFVGWVDLGVSGVATLASLASSPGGIVGSARMIAADIPFVKTPAPKGLDQARAASLEEIFNNPNLSKPEDILKTVQEVRGESWGQESLNKLARRNQRVRAALDTVDLMTEARAGGAVEAETQAPSSLQFPLVPIRLATTPEKQASDVIMMSITRPLQRDTIARYPVLSQALRGAEVPPAARPVVEAVASGLRARGLPATIAGLHEGISTGKVPLLMLDTMEDTIHRAALVEAGVPVDSLRAARNLGLLAAKRPDDVILSHAAERQANVDLEAARDRVAASVQEEARKVSRAQPEVLGETQQAQTGAEAAKAAASPQAANLEALGPSELPHGAPMPSRQEVEETAFDKGQTIPEAVEEHRQELVSRAEAGDMDAIEDLESDYKPEEWQVDLENLRQEAMPYSEPLAIEPSSVTAFETSESSKAEGWELSGENVRRQLKESETRQAKEALTPEVETPDDEAWRDLKRFGIKKSAAEKGRFMGELENVKGRGIVRSNGQKTIGEWTEYMAIKGVIKESTEQAFFDWLDNMARKTSPVSAAMVREAYVPYGKVPAPGNTLADAMRNDPIDEKSARRYGVLEDLKQVIRGTKKGGADVKDWLARRKEEGLLPKEATIHDVVDALKFSPKKVVEAKVPEGVPIFARQMTPEDFQESLKESGVGIGSQVTARFRFDVFNKGDKMQVVGINRTRGELAVRPLGGDEPRVVRPENIVETWRKPSAAAAFEEARKATGEQTVPTKRLISLATSGPEQPKVATEMDVLRAKLQAEAKGASSGARLAARETRTKLLSDFKAKIDSIKTLAGGKIESLREIARQKTAIQAAVAGYINEHLPPDLRGKFLIDLRDAKTPEDALDTFVSVDFEATERRKEDIFEDAVRVNRRIQDSKSISVPAKKEARRIFGLRIGDAKKKDLVDIDESVLETLLTHLRALEEIGRGQADAYKEGRALVQDIRAADIVADSIPINRLHENLRGKQNDPKNYGLYASLKRGAYHVTNWLQKLWYVKNPMDVVLSIGSKNGGYLESAAWRHFKAPLDAAFRRKLGDYYDFLDPLVELSQGITDAEMHDIGIVAARDQEGGFQKLLNSGYEEREIRNVKLAPKSQTLLDKWRETSPKLFELLKEFMARRYNVELVQVPNYFSFQSDKDEYMENKTLEQMLDQHVYFDQRPGSPNFKKKVFQGMTIERTGSGKQAIDTHFMRVVTRNIRATFHLLHVQEPLEDAYELAKRPEVAEALGSLKQREVMLWLDLVARDGGVEGHNAQNGLDVMRRHLSTAAIPFRLATILVHVTKVLNTSAFFGGPKVAAAMRELASNPDWPAFLETNFPSHRKLIGDDPSYEEFSIGKITNEDLTSLPKKMAKIGATPLIKLNGWSNAVSLVTAYTEKMRQLGLPVDLKNPNPEALEYAELMARRSQDSPQYQDMPPLLSRGEGLAEVVGKSAPSVARAYFQFGLYKLNQWSNIENDVWRLGVKKGEFKRAANMTAFLLGQMASDAGIRMGVNNMWVWLMAGAGAAVGLSEVPYGLRKKRTFVDRFTDGMLSTIPYYPAWAHSAFYGNGLPEMPVQSGIGMVTRAGTEVFSRKNIEALRGVLGSRSADQFAAEMGEAAQGQAKTMMDAIRGIASLTGTPGLMPAMELGAIMTDNRMAFPYEKEFSVLDARAKHDHEVMKQSGLSKEEKEDRLHMRGDDWQRYALLRDYHKGFNQYAAAYRDAMSKQDLDGAARITQRMLVEMKDLERKLKQ